MVHIEHDPMLGGESSVEFEGDINQSTPSVGQFEYPTQEHVGSNTFREVKSYVNYDKEIAGDNNGLNEGEIIRPKINRNLPVKVKEIVDQDDSARHAQIIQKAAQSLDEEEVFQDVTDDDLAVILGTEDIHNVSLEEVTAAYAQASRMLRLQNVSSVVETEYIGTHSDAPEIREMSANSEATEKLINAAKMVATTFPKSVGKHPVHLPLSQAQQLDAKEKAEFYANTAQAMADATFKLRPDAHNDIAALPLNLPGDLESDYQVEIPLDAVGPNGLVIHFRHREKSGESVKPGESLGHINLQLTYLPDGSLAAELGDVQHEHQDFTKKHRETYAAEVERRRGDGRQIRSYLNPSKDPEKAEKQMEFVALTAEALAGLIERQVITPETPISRKDSESLYWGEFHQPTISKAIEEAKVNLIKQVTGGKEMQNAPDTLVADVAAVCNLDKDTLVAEAEKICEKMPQYHRLPKVFKREALNGTALELAARRSPEFYSKFRNYPDSPHDPFYEISPNGAPVRAGDLITYTRTSMFTSEAQSIAQSNIPWNEKRQKMQELEMRYAELPAGANVETQTIVNATLQKHERTVLGRVIKKILGAERNPKLNADQRADILACEMRDLTQGGVLSESRSNNAGIIIENAKKLQRLVSEGILSKEVLQDIDLLEDSDRVAELLHSNK